METEEEIDQTTSNFAKEHIKKKFPEMYSECVVKNCNGFEVITIAPKTIIVCCYRHKYKDILIVK